MIDLHLHTTASDGRCSPRELVERAVFAGVSIMAVTDHDTTAGVDDVQQAAREHGIHAIAGIEITAVEDGRDVHVLGYFVDPGDDSPMAPFLAGQRESRIARVEAIGQRLAELGMPIDTAALIAASRQRTGKSIGRPQVAGAMIAVGHVADIREAFDRWLGTGCPAFVSRVGPPIETVIAIVHRAGGLASLAHPGRTKIDARIPALRDAGLDAIEVHHTDHGAEDVARYQALAAALGLLATGGSDFHGDPARGFEPGAASLPAAAWDRLSAARDRHASRR